MRNLSPCLTEKQLRWIDEYLVDFNGAAAAVRAGYSLKSARSIAHENTTKPDIQAVLQARQEVMAKELRITRLGVIQGLLEAVEMGRAQQNPGAMVGALREVTKILGFNAPEVKRLELNPGAAHTLSKYSQMQDHELIALMSGGAGMCEQTSAALSST